MNPKEEIILNKAPVTVNGLNSRLRAAFVRPPSGPPLGRKPKPAVVIKPRPSSAIATTMVTDILCPISRKETNECFAQPKGKEPNLQKQSAAVSSSRISSARTACISPKSCYVSESTSSIFSTMEQTADAHNKSVKFASQVGDKTSDKSSTQTRRGSRLPLSMFTRRKSRSQSLQVGFLSNGEKWGNGGEAQWERRHSLMADMWRSRNMVEEEETYVDKVSNFNLWSMFIYPS